MQVAAAAAAAGAGRHCMVGEELEVGSPLPHKEVVNSLAKTLKRGGRKEKLLHWQLLQDRLQAHRYLIPPPAYPSSDNSQVQAGQRAVSDFPDVYREDSLSLGGWKAVLPLTLVWLERHTKPHPASDQEQVAYQCRMRDLSSRLIRNMAGESSSALRHR